MPKMKLLENKSAGRKSMIALIDYDAGNIRSVEKALAALGEETR